VDDLRDSLAAKPSLQISSSPSPPSQNVITNRKQLADPAKPAVVDEEAEKSSSEDEGEDEIDADEEEELASDKVSNTKRFERHPLV
jgi:hypothetical protein